MKTEKSKQARHRTSGRFPRLVFIFSDETNIWYNIFSLGEFRGEYEQKGCRSYDIYNSDRASFKKTTQEQEQRRKIQNKKWQSGKKTCGGIYKKNKIKKV